MTRRLYRTPIPESAFRDTGETARTELSKLAALGGGTSSVESAGTEPGQLTLNVQYRGKYAGRLALELSELLHSDAFTGLPYAPVDGAAEDDGYYSAESVSPGRIRPQTDRAVNVDATLARDGTRATHLQAVETSATSVENDIGNSSSETFIGVPASASLVQWWDGDAGIEYPSPVATRSAEFGDVEIYDVDAAGVGGDSPTLLYRPAGYDAIGDVDCGVWDTYGAGSKADSNGVIQWQRVFSTTHDARGALVLENGLLRLTLDDQAQTFTAERWDSSTSSWATVSLGTSAWQPIDVDVRTISPARLAARILFSDGSTRYPLDCILSRGDQNALFALTPNATSATPQGLIDLLDPIAASTVYDTGESQTLVARDEIAQ